MSWEKKYKKIRNEIFQGRIGISEIHENIDSKQQCYMKKIQCKDSIREKYTFTKEEQYIQTKQIFDKLITIKHPNLIEIYDVYYQEKDFTIYIFMELCKKNLNLLLKEKEQLLQDDAQKNIFIMNLLKQIINGYCRLMEDNIIHRDLKLENILCNIKNDEIIFKISDYGYSKIINMNQIYNMTQMDESPYSAPEIKEDEYSNKCDVYSFGIILLQLIQLNNQFTEEQKQSLPNFIVNNTKGLSQEIVTLLEKMLKTDPKHRISWTELRLRYFYPEFNLTEQNQLQYIKDIKDINGNNVCVKQICKVKNNACHNELNEIIINKKIKDNQEQNENIVKVIEILNEKDYSYAYIIMERCDGDLAKLRTELGFYDFQKIFGLLQDVNNGYQFLIKNKIVHRDIKPQNILYLKTNSGYRYKLTDFGYSFNIGNQNYSPNTKTGTSKYQAPEVDGKQKYDHQCDIYSLGIIILEMAMEAKFDENVEQIKDQLKNEPIILNIISNLSGYEKLQLQTINMIKKTVKYNPNERISWEELNNEIKSMTGSQSQLPISDQQSSNIQLPKIQINFQNYASFALKINSQPNKFQVQIPTQIKQYPPKQSQSFVQFPNNKFQPAIFFKQQQNKSQ